MILVGVGGAWREADIQTADLETVIEDLMAGEYRRPIRVIAFNTAERWSEDVSEDIAGEGTRMSTAYGQTGKGRRLRASQ
jgi:hypothetical protein